MADTNALVDQLSGLTVLEIAGLVKQLEEKWGVSAAAPVAMAAAPAAGSGAAPAATAAEEKTKEMHPGEMASEVLPATNNVERSTARRNSVTSAPTENLPVQLMECR